MLLSDLLTNGYLITHFPVAGGLVQVGGRVVFLPFSTVTSLNWYRGCISNCICTVLCVYIFTQCSHFGAVLTPLH